MKKTLAKVIVTFAAVSLTAIVCAAEAGKPVMPAIDAATESSAATSVQEDENAEKTMTKAEIKAAKARNRARAKAAKAAAEAKAAQAKTESRDEAFKAFGLGLLIPGGHLHNYNFTLD
jgi:hypothetical protein